MAEEMVIDASPVSESESDEKQHVSEPDGSPRATTFSKISVWLTLSFMAIAQVTDGYNASVIGYLYFFLVVQYPDAMTDSMYNRLSNAFLIGMIVGTLIFGYVADLFGRKTSAVATTGLLTLGIVLSTAASGTTPNGLMWMMVIARGIAGVGAGGEYPTTGAAAMEATDEASNYRKHRGFIFATLGEVAASFGYCLGPLIPLILYVIVGQNEAHYELIWRLSFALGMIPTLSIFYFRLRIAVSNAYRKSALRNQRAPYLLIVKKYWLRLIAGSLSWFLYNWIAIPFGIFSSVVISKANSDNTLLLNLAWGVVINAFYLPGPFLGGWLVDRIGRRYTMALGFGCQAVLGFILGGAYSKIETIFPLFVVLYGVFLTFGEIGPGSVIGLVSTEPFPTSVRGQTSGLVSAVAKAGAAIGTQVFNAILNAYDSSDKGNQVVFMIGSAIAVIGVLVSLFLVEEVSRNLDDEDRIWKEYLAVHGVEVSWGDNTKDQAAVLKQATTLTS